MIAKQRLMLLTLLIGLVPAVVAAGIAVATGSAG